MSILVYITTNNGVGKSAFEAVTYAKKIGGEVTVLTTGSCDASALESLGQYGASKVLVDRSVETNEAQLITKVIASGVESTGSDLIVFSHDIVAKSVAPRLSVKLISFAIVTPSLTICGVPNFLPSTTFRPFGPKVMEPASAKVSIPFSIAFRAAS